MGILPVLFVIIAIATVLANYNKIAKQRLEDQKKRMEMRASAEPADDRNEAIYKKPAKTTFAASEPIERIHLNPAPKCAPGVSVKKMREAVILSEILDKPVSLREK